MTSRARDLSLAVLARASAAGAATGTYERVLLSLALIRIPDADVRAAIEAERTERADRQRRRLVKGVL